MKFEYGESLTLRLNPAIWFRINVLIGLEMSALADVIDSPINYDETMTSMQKSIAETQRVIIEDPSELVDTIYRALVNVSDSYVSGTCKGIVIEFCNEYEQ